MFIKFAVKVYFISNILLSTNLTTIYILKYNMLPWVSISMQILILTKDVFHWKYLIIQVWRLSTILTYHACEPCLLCIIQNSVRCFEKMYSFSVNMVRKANIGGAKMANNRHAVNKNFLQSYWTSNGLSLFNSQLDCEESHPH